MVPGAGVSFSTHLWFDCHVNGDDSVPLSRGWHLQRPGRENRSMPLTALVRCRPITWTFLLFIYPLWTYLVVLTDIPPHHATLSALPHTHTLPLQLRHNAGCGQFVDVSLLTNINILGASDSGVASLKTILMPAGGSVHALFASCVAHGCASYRAFCRAAFPLPARPSPHRLPGMAWWWCRFSQVRCHTTAQCSVV